MKKIKQHIIIDDKGYDVTKIFHGDTLVDIEGLPKDDAIPSTYDWFMKQYKERKLRDSKDKLGKEVTA